MPQYSTINVNFFHFKYLNGHETHVRSMAPVRRFMNDYNMFHIVNIMGHDLVSLDNHPVQLHNSSSRKYSTVGACMHGKLQSGSSEDGTLPTVKSACPGNLFQHETTSPLLMRCSGIFHWAWRRSFMLTLTVESYT